MRRCRPSSGVEFPNEEKAYFEESKKAQSNIVMGFPGVKINDDRRYALQVMQSVLAGQGGRLFVELRRQGVAYAVLRRATARMDGFGRRLFRRLYWVLAREVEEGDFRHAAKKWNSKILQDSLDCRGRIGARAKLSDWPPRHRASAEFEHHEFHFVRSDLRYRLSRGPTVSPATFAKSRARTVRDFGCGAIFAGQRRFPSWVLNGPM